jgi:hypothetical protein
MCAAPDSFLPAIATCHLPSVACVCGIWYGVGAFGVNWRGAGLVRLFALLFLPRVPALHAAASKEEGHTDRARSREVGSGRRVEGEECVGGGQGGMGVSWTATSRPLAHSEADQRCSSVPPGASMELKIFSIPAISTTCAPCVARAAHAVSLVRTMLVRMFACAQARRWYAQGQPETRNPKP